MDFTKRIKVNIADESDKYLKFKLEQNTKNIEILSLKLSQDNLYGTFNADFGVVVGRVIANGGVGIPNAKISIFIPISNEDKENPNIYALYPYETPRDLNTNSKRYNLLPRTSRKNRNGSYKPKQPFGSFPNKEEILTNETYLDVYKKYYKYTTVTNNSGDYMLFGVPVGIQSVHMSVDITDIGDYSMSPIQMIQNLGYSPYLFTDDGISIKPQKLLEDIPNIETQEISVNVIPFWGDTENFEIGITRQDFKIRAELISSVVIFGTIGTMGEPCVIGTPERYTRTNRAFYLLSEDVKQNIDARTLRGSDDLNFRVFSYNNNISEDDIISDLAMPLTGLTIIDYKMNRKIDPAVDIIELDKSQFYTYVKDGMFVLIVQCDRDKIITDEYGNKIVTSDDNVGIYSKFLGSILIDYEANEKLTITQDHGGDTYYGGDTAINTRAITKIPQQDNNLKIYYQSEDTINDSDDTESKNNYLESEKWRKSYFKLELGNYYSISQFFPTISFIDSPFATLTLPKNTNNLSDNTDLENYNIHGMVFKTGGIDYLSTYEYKYDNLNQSGTTFGVISYNFSDESIFPNVYTTISADTNYVNNTLRLYATSGQTMIMESDSLSFDGDVYDFVLNLNGSGSTIGTKHNVAGIYLAPGTYNVNILCSASTSTNMYIDTYVKSLSGLSYLSQSITLGASGETFIYSTNTDIIKIFSISIENTGADVINTFDYDFPYNKQLVRNTYLEKYFGAQWINMFLVLPQFSYAQDYQHESRKMQVANILLSEREKDSFFLEFNSANNQLIMGSAYRSVNILRANTFRTDLVNIPKSQFYVLNNINKKALTSEDLIGIDVSNFKYQTHSSTTSYDYSTAYDETNKGPYLFKGFYNNDCIKLLYDLNIL